MGFEQTVDLSMQRASFWTAVYTLQRQPDGSWEDQQLRFGEEAGSSGLTYGASPIRHCRGISLTRPHV
jgi:hypothetical protein